MTNVTQHDENTNPKDNDITAFTDHSLMEAFEQQLASHRRFFDSDVTMSYEWRMAQLKALKQLIKKHQKDILHALYQDLGKSAREAQFTEVIFTLSEIDFCIKKLKSWMKARKLSSPLVSFPAKSFIVHQPLGVALIISTWNYPFRLSLGPLIGAISAGCCAIVKPSELSPATSQLIAKLIPDYLDSRAYSVIEGGKDESEALLKLPFDKFFYTGGEQAGKLVMKSAAKHIAAVTLELGGKSPCLIDSDSDLDITASRIVWGKLLNAGQTCFAPDYLLVEESVKQRFIDKLKHAIETQYGKAIKQNQDYGRIVNARHCQRLAGYLVDQDVVYGGDIDIQNRFISPTIVLDPPVNSPLMQEEIFGPIIPVIGMSSRDEMLSFVRQRPKSLSAYVFSNDNNFTDEFANKVSAGNLCINDIGMFLSNLQLPFGGVGSSGIGRYHGEHSFKAFSYTKSLMIRSFRFENKIRYAPFTAVKTWLLKTFL